MATLDQSFSGGTAPVLEAGQKSKVRFAYTWVDGDTWTIPFTSTLTGDFTVGKGNIAGQTYASVGKLKDRLYLGFGSTFALSGVSAPTGWEEQNPGAATINYLTQYGVQDSVVAFGSVQGRLAVIGSLSIQMWDVDANPQNFVLQQTMDNTGTSDPLSVQSIGDLDLLYLDKSGVRSLRAKESTLNAYVSDMGTAVDLLIRAALRSYTAGTACAIVEPTTRQYWLWVYDRIYVLSYYPQSKITAWSTYRSTYTTIVAASVSTYQAPGGIAPYTTVIGKTYYWLKGSNATELRKNDATVILSNSGSFVATELNVFEVGTIDATVNSELYLVSDFTPRKFVVSNNQVYMRSDDNQLYLYGGVGNNTFDRSRLSVVLPWLNLGEPSTHKQFKGLDAAFVGMWNFYASSNPRATVPVKVISRGSGSLMTEDSTYDLGHFGYSGHGTHIKISAESFDDMEAKLGKLGILYDLAEKK